MNKILLSLFLVISLISTAWANNGWYSTLQGTASDVEQTPPPNGVTIAYNTTDHQWEFNYGLAPAGGTTGTCLEKNSNSDYDYSWVTCSGSGSGLTVGTTTIANGTNGYVEYNNNGVLGEKAVSGTGTVTAVSVSSSNGFTGTSSGGATPALTLATSITGILKGNGTAISAATSGTDYAPATSGSSLLYGNSSGGFSNVSIGTGMAFTTGTLSTTVTSPTGANPSATIGLSANNGSASTFMRSDASPALGVGITPTWTGEHIFNGSPSIVTGGNVGISSANPGQKLDIQGTARMLGLYSPQLEGTIIVIDGTVYPQNSTGINAAIATIATDGAGTILMPPGTYDITSAITITNKAVSLIGMSSSVHVSSTTGTFLSRDSSYTSGPLISYTNSGSYKIDGVQFRDFSVYGQGLAGDCIDTVGLQNALFSNVAIEYCGTSSGTSAGLSIDTNSTQSATLDTFSKMLIAVNGIDVKVSDSGAGSGQYVTALYFTDGTNIVNSSNAAGQEIQLNNDSTINVSDSYIESNPSHATETCAQLNGTSFINLNGVDMDCGGTTELDGTNDTLSGYPILIAFNSDIYGGSPTLINGPNASPFYVLDKSTDNLTLPGYVSIGTSSILTPLAIQGKVINDLPTMGSEFLTGSGWTSTNWTGSWAGGWAHTTGNTSVLSFPTSASNSTQYQITTTTTGTIGSGYTVAFGGQSESISSTGTVGWGPTTTSTGNLQITPTSTFGGTIVITIFPLTNNSSPVLNLYSSNGTNQFQMRESLGGDNVSIGIAAGGYYTTGNYNNDYGYESQQNTTSGTNNNSFGSQSLQDNVLGTYNSAFGDSALTSSVNASSNSAFGGYSLTADTAGNSNACFGYVCMPYITTGSNDTGIGVSAGQYITGGSTHNITSGTSTYLGANTKASANGDTNETVIGYNATGNGSNSVTIGNSSVTKNVFSGGNVGVGSSNPSQALDVNGTVRATNFIGAGTGLTGTASALSIGGNAATSTTAPTTALLATGTVTGATSQAQTFTDGIISNGNVGIGTITPLDNLQINALAGGETLNGVTGGIGGIDNNTIIMAHLNNNVTDSSQNAFTGTNNSLTFTNSGCEFSTEYCGVFNGSSSTAQYTNPTQLGTGNFTIDFWIKYGASGTQGNFNKILSAGNTEFHSSLESGTSLTFNAEVGGSSKGYYTLSWTPTLNTWYHLAFVRSGTTFYEFINGVSQSYSTVTAISTNNIDNYNAAFYIGADVNDSHYLNGNIQEFRISNTARWTSNFTPPASPYTNSNATPVLTFANNGTTISTINSNSATQNLSFINQGVTAETINSLGNVGIGSANPGQALDVVGTIRTTGLVTTGNVGIGTSVVTSSITIGGTCKTIGPVGTCWTATGQLGYCSGAANVCSTCTAC